MFEFEFKSQEKNNCQIFSINCVRECGEEEGYMLGGGCSVAL